MKNYLKLSAWLFLIPALMFSSCKDDDKSDGDPLPVVTIKQPEC